MTKIYGIVNCDTMKKARAWLDSHGVQYEFHDYKKIGIDEQRLHVWCKVLGWEKVLNRSGMMWRKASEFDKVKVVDEPSAIEFMIRVPTSIKRPVLEYDGGILLGFDVHEYKQKLG